MTVGRHLFPVLCPRRLIDPQRREKFRSECRVVPHQLLPMGWLGIGAEDLAPLKNREIEMVIVNEPPEIQRRGWVDGSQYT